MEWLAELYGNTFFEKQMHRYIHGTEGSILCHFSLNSSVELMLLNFLVFLMELFKVNEKFIWKCKGSEPSRYSWKASSAYFSYQTWRLKKLCWWEECLLVQGYKNCQINRTLNIVKITCKKGILLRKTWTFQYMNVEQLIIHGEKNEIGSLPHKKSIPGDS